MTVSATSAANSHCRGGSQVLVEREAIGDVGRALGELGAALLEGGRQRRRHDLADLESLIPRVDALCARRPLYPGFRGFTTYPA